jgi:hypothetical protein
VAIVSSSNINMLKEDPLGPFLVQHLGSPQNPFKSWGLNFRTMETMHTLLEKAGFDEIAIYDDANYPGQEGLSDEILHGVDPLPSAAIGGSSSRTPLNLPKTETLSRRVGYNWIAVAKKY